MRLTSTREARVQVLADLLAMHEYITQFRGAVCICGHVPDVHPESLRTQQDYHRAHLAEVIVSAGYDRRDHVAEADALRKQVEG
jgi:hypothetical protein